MAAREKMLAALIAADSPVCDDCIWELAGLSSRQRAYQTGQQLQAVGALSRGDGTCAVCAKYKTVSRPTGQPIPAPATTMETDVADRPWHWEGNVQAALVESLSAEGWSILNTANTATKEAGVDVIARDPAGAEWWISVKGYPEERATKATRPAVQARHWFSHAMFDVAMYRTERADVRIGVAIPGPYITYERLFEKSRWLQRTAPYTLFTVHQSGRVVATASE